jgi:hypothetical protein
VTAKLQPHPKRKLVGVSLLHSSNYGRFPISEFSPFGEVRRLEAVSTHRKSCISLNPIGVGGNPAIKLKLKAAIPPGHS